MANNIVNKRVFNPALLVLFLAVIALLTIVITILSYLNASVYGLSFYGLILFFSCSLLALVFVLSTIILDKRYRPSIAQYPYNYYLDRLFPLIALFCPSILVLLLCPSTVSLIQRFTILLLIHCFILIPLFYYWSGLRQWNLLASSLPFNHPQVFFQIALAVIYPAIWGIYFSTIRYIRMGLTIDFSVYLQIVNPEIFIIICFIFYYFFPLLIRIASFLNTIRTYLWDHTASLLYSIHIILLRYYVYFRLCEIIYKTHFLYHDIFSGSVGATTWDLKVAPFYRRIISYIYYHSFILTILFFISLLSELLLTQGKLHYGIYSLFVYPVIFSIFRCFNSFGSSQFIKDVCLCDYLTHNLTKPRYPSMFWFYLGNANLWFGFEQRFHPDLVDVLGRTLLLEQVAYKHFTKFHSALIYRVWGRTRINIKEYPYRITFVTGYPKPWRIRVAGIYLHLKHVRWFHTTRVLYAPLQDKIHPLTIHFIKKDPYAILALLNHPTATIHNLDMQINHLQNKKDFIKGISGLYSLSAEKKETLGSNSLEGIRLKKTLTLQIIRVLFTLFSGQEIKDQFDIIKKIQPLLKSFIINNEKYKDLDFHYPFIQHITASIFTNKGFDSQYLQDKNEALIDYSSYLNKPISILNLIENEILLKTMGTFLQMNRNKVKITALNPDNLTEEQRLYKNQCYLTMKQPWSDYSGVIYNIENVKNKQLFLDVKLRGEPEKTLSSTKGFLSLCPSFNKILYMKRYFGDIGTSINQTQKLSTTEKIALNIWRLDLLEIIKSKATLVEKLIKFYNLNEAQILNSDIIITMPSILVEAELDDAFTLYYKLHFEAFDDVVDELYQEIIEDVLFPLGQTVNVKDLDLLLCKMIEKLPKDIKDEIMENYQKAKILTIQL